MHDYKLDCFLISPVVGGDSSRKDKVKKMIASLKKRGYRIRVSHSRYMGMEIDCHHAPSIKNRFFHRFYGLWASRTVNMVAASESEKDNHRAFMRLSKALRYRQRVEFLKNNTVEHKTIQIKMDDFGGSTTVSIEKEGSNKIYGHSLCRNSDRFDNSTGIYFALLGLMEEPF